MAVDDDEFATVVADGVIAHFLEGFASLLFYLDKVRPIYGDDVDRKKFQTERQTLFDVRLPINALKRLKKDLDQGLRMYTATSLLPIVDFWVGNMTYQREKELRDPSTEEIEDIQDRALLGTVIDAMGQTESEAQSKIRNIVMQCLHNHAEEINKIVQEYTEASVNEDK
jgi:hypothetical protein